MPKATKAFGRLLILSWSKALVYRVDIFTYLVFSLISPLVALAVWYSVAKNGGLPLNPREVVTYYLFIMFVELMTRAWRGMYLVEQILTGKVVAYIIRPPAILWEFVTSNITTKIIQTTLPLILLLVAVILFPQFFSPNIYEPTRVLLFCLSLALAIALSFSFDLSLGMLAFWLEEAHEIHGYRFFLMQVASGILIPLSVMPPTLQAILNWLPFRYIIAAPVEIIMGQAQALATWQVIGLQALWLLGFAVVLRVLFIFGVRRYAVPGQ